MSELSKVLKMRQKQRGGILHALTETKMKDMRGERLQIMLSPEELTAVDDFRFKQRMPTRAAAVRELLKFGLASTSIVTADGSKSSDYGVMRRGPAVHPDDGADNGD